MARYPIRCEKQMIEVAQLVLEENIEGCTTRTFEEAGVSHSNNGFVVEVDGRTFLFTVSEIGGDNMKCDRCGREITGQVFTAAGVNICEECNTKSNGTVSMNDVFAKIEREANERR